MMLSGFGCIAAQVESSAFQAVDNPKHKLKLEL